jgi:NagD protein
MIKHYICDMDGVVYRGNKLIPGIIPFLRKLRETGRNFLFLTNSSGSTPAQLQKKLETLGLPDIEAFRFFTAGMATAQFLATQKARKSAYVIGGEGLKAKLIETGFTLTDEKPEYVVVGHTPAFNFDMLKTAVRLIRSGSRFIATNPDVLDPVENGVLDPACGSLVAAIQAASEKMPYFIGKPNPLMMRMARERMKLEPEQLVMVGDKMDTDIRAGVEAGMTTVLVLSGVTPNRESIAQYPYQPDYIFEHAGEIDPGVL